MTHDPANRLQDLLVEQLDDAGRRALLDALTAGHPLLAREISAAHIELRCGPVRIVVNRLLLGAKSDTPEFN